MHALTVNIVDGQFRVQLVPDANLTPVSYYTVKYSSDGRFNSMKPGRCRPARGRCPIRDVRWPRRRRTRQRAVPFRRAMWRVWRGPRRTPGKGPGFAPGRAAVVGSSAELRNRRSGIRRTASRGRHRGPVRQRRQLECRTFGQRDAVGAVRWQAMPVSPWPALPIQPQA